MLALRTTPDLNRQTPAKRGGYDRDEVDHYNTFTVF
jgi:hypothetical protein